jgi:hypothetical protein
MPRRILSGSGTTISVKQCVQKNWCLPKVPLFTSPTANSVEEELPEGKSFVLCRIVGPNFSSG